MNYKLISILLVSFFGALPFFAKEGYKLKYGGKIVGTEKKWNIRQSIANFRGLTVKYPNIKIEASFNSQNLVYLETVKILPVFFVPKGVKGPSNKICKNFNKHLLIAQKRYHKMLKGKDTFKISKKKALKYKSKFPTSHYQDSENGASKIVSELLDILNLTRFNCPYIFAILFQNNKSHFPVGGGRPINGGVNTGGGIVLLSSYALKNKPNFQSTLQHELGHSFGLCHVDVLGYDMKLNTSIMSYNTKHHWKKFKPPKIQGILIPENIKRLSMNKMVFTKLKWNSEIDIPEGYSFIHKHVELGEMNFPK